MSQNIQNYSETEIDISQYIDVVIKRKFTLIVIFLLVLAVGVACILFSPKKYRSVMMIQPPVSGEALTGASDLESAENLKGLIINNAFHDDLSKRLEWDQEKEPIIFKVSIPASTNILQVSVDLDAKKKKMGLVILRNLADLISNSYTRRIEAEHADISSQIKSRERAIINAKEKSKSLQDQINEIISRKNKLREEIQSVNNNTAQILEKRQGLLKGNAATESASTLLLANYLQNNSSYLNQVNNQLSELAMRRVNLELELKNATVQINNYQTGIEKLNIKNDFISNLRIIFQPKLLPYPVGPSKKKVLAIAVIAGLFLGFVVIFLQEYWVSNFK